MFFLLWGSFIWQRWRTAPRPVTPGYPQESASIFSIFQASFKVPARALCWRHSNESLWIDLCFLWNVSAALAFSSLPYETLSAALRRIVDYLVDVVIFLMLRRHQPVFSVIDTLEKVIWVLLSLALGLCPCFAIAAFGLFTLLSLKAGILKPYVYIWPKFYNKWLNKRSRCGRLFQCVWPGNACPQTATSGIWRPPLRKNIGGGTCLPPRRTHTHTHPCSYHMHLSIITKHCAVDSGLMSNLMLIPLCFALLARWLVPWTPRSRSKDALSLILPYLSFSPFGSLW